MHGIHSKSAFSCWSRRPTLGSSHCSRKVIGPLDGASAAEYAPQTLRSVETLHFRAPLVRTLRVYCKRASGSNASDKKSHLRKTKARQYQAVRSSNVVYYVYLPPLSRTRHLSSTAKLGRATPVCSRASYTFGVGPRFAEMRRLTSPAGPIRSSDLTSSSASTR